MAPLGHAHAVPRLQDRPHLYTVQADMSLSSDRGLFFVVLGQISGSLGAFDQLASDLKAAQATDRFGSLVQTLS